MIIKETSDSASFQKNHKKGEKYTKKGQQRRIKNNFTLKSIDKRGGPVKKIVHLEMSEMIKKIYFLSGYQLAITTSISGFPAFTIASNLSIFENPSEPRK